MEASVTVPNEDRKRGVAVREIQQVYDVIQIQVVTRIMMHLAIQRKEESSWPGYFWKSVYFPNYQYFALEIMIQDTEALKPLSGNPTMDDWKDQPFCSGISINHERSI